MRPAVDIIIPTAGDARRAQLLIRAVHSVLNQAGVQPHVIVVFNGPNGIDPLLFDGFKADPRVRVEHLVEPGLLLARYHGRSLVTADYFGFLDDDDEYLPGAISTRLEPLLYDSSLDFVATNGLIDEGARTRAHIDDAAAVNADPLRALLQRNWLASCGALYRSARVPIDYFDGLSRFNEWTLFGFRLLNTGRRVTYLDTPTFRITCTPVSISRSPLDYTSSLETLLALEEMRRTGPPSMYARFETLRRETLHECANLYYEAGDLRNAWYYHGKTLCSQSGWRHLKFACHLLRATLAGVMRRPAPF